MNELATLAACVARGEARPAYQRAFALGRAGWLAERALAQRARGEDRSENVLNHALGSRINDFMVEVFDALARGILTPSSFFVQLARRLAGRHIDSVPRASVAVERPSTRASPIASALAAASACSIVAPALDRERPRRERRARIACMMLLPLLAAASGGRSTVPAKIHTHTCPDGLTVLVIESHAVPLITVEITAKNGSMTEPPEYNGLSHLYEHMFFKANKALPSQEAWRVRAQELGLNYNGHTKTEQVNYFFTTTTDHLVDSMQLMHDAIVYPLFDQKELERERVVVTGEIDRNEANPFYQLSHAVDQRVWWKYPSRKDSLGLRATVLKTTRAQMETIQHRYYVPNNSALVITGDVSADEVFALADKLYADWARGDDPFVTFPLVSHPPIQKTEAVVVVQPVHVIDGQMVWHGPSTVGPSVPDTYAADALATALRAPSSRFQKALVDSGACVTARFSWYTQMNTGPITASFEATPDKVDTCIRTIRAELAKMTADYVTPEDLARGAHELEVQVVQKREQPSELAHTLTFWWTSAGLDYYLGYVDNLYKVTPADTAHYISTYITNKPFVLGVMLSPEMKKRGLDTAHFQKLIAEVP